MDGSGMSPEVSPADLKLAADEEWVSGDKAAYGGEGSTAGWKSVRKRLEESGVDYENIVKDLRNVIYGERTPETVEEVGRAFDRLQTHGFTDKELNRLRQEWLERNGRQGKKVKKEKGREVVALSNVDQYMAGLTENERAEFSRIRATAGADNRLPSDEEAIGRFEEVRRSRREQAGIDEERPERTGEGRSGKGDVFEGEFTVVSSGEVVKEEQPMGGFENVALRQAATMMERLGKPELFSRVLEGLIAGSVELSDADLDRAAALLRRGETIKSVPKTDVEPTKREIRELVPKTERELRLFLRRRALGKLDDILNIDLLTVDSVLGAIVKDLMQEAGTTESISIFPGWLDGRREIVEMEVKGEIGHLCNLRAAEIREDEYQGTAAKNAAALYIRDFDGAPETSSKAVDIANLTLDALRHLPDLGPEGMTTQKIDRAFAILLWMGEDDTRVGSAPNWVTPFLKYRGVVNEHGVVENFHNSKYPAETREDCLNEIEKVYGKDAKEVALKMFNGLRMGSRFNNMHYFAQFVQFADNRDFMWRVLGTAVGSKRIYVDPDENDRDNGHGSFKDELIRLAYSPLEIKVEEKGLKTQGTYYDRALRGVFLTETNFKSRGVNSIDRTYLQAIKSANKVRTAIVGIGEIGDKTSDKSGKVDAAVNNLIAIATAGKDLVELGVFTLDDLREQIKREAKNIIWEFSTRNEINMPFGQKKEALQFLLPSGYIRLIALISKATLEGVSKWPDGSRYIIMSDDDLAELSEYAEEMVELSFTAYGRLETGDPEKVRDRNATEGGAAKLKLPRVRGAEAATPISVEAHRIIKRTVGAARQLNRLLYGDGAKL